MYIDIIKNYKPKNEFEAQDKKVMLEYIERHKDNILTRENEIAHICASSFILNKNLDKTLMIHHNIYNSWGWTGGHADGDPDLLNIALEEAREETGVQNFQFLSELPQALDIIPVWAHYKNGKPISSHLHLNITYLLTTDESEQLLIKEDENSAVAWIPVAEIAHYCSEPWMIPIYLKLVAAAKSLNASD